MQIRETFEDINKCMSDWPRFLANKNATERGNIIAWPNYSPNIVKDVTWATVSDLATSRQYSLQFLDGSIVQMVYDFSGKSRSLKKAALAYYEFTSEDIDDEGEGEVIPLAEDIRADTPRWLRLDYDEGVENSCIHAPSHLHLSGFPSTRISCAGVPGPRQFIETLLAWLYPETYRDGALDGVDEPTQTARFIDVNRLCFRLNPTGHSHSILHIGLPRSIRQGGNVEPE